MVGVCLISYANKAFEKNQLRLNKSGKNYEIKSIISYNEEDLKATKFYNKYKDILDQPQGAGYWLWKPFFIYKTLTELNEGDYLIYSDSGAVFVNNPLPLLKLARKEKVLLFDSGERNIKWNKNRCLSQMGCNSEKYLNEKATQVSAGFQIYINNERSRKFVKEWLYFCCQPGLIDDMVSKPGEYEEYAAYKEHRHDQSILTNLAIKHNIPLYRDPSQGGNKYKPLGLRQRGEWLPYPYRYKSKKELDIKSNYPTIINHLRNTSNFKLFLIKLHSKLPRWLKLIIRKK